MKTVIITGGTGGIGTALTGLLIKRGYKIIIFTRPPDKYKKDTEQVSYAWWDPSEPGFDTQSIAEADAIINLAGAGIANGRWTKERMREIYDSRINSNKTIVTALKEVPNRVRTVVNASAVGYYGKGDGVHSYTEDDPPGTGFLSHVCEDWEEGIKPVSASGKRCVILRTGMVLDTGSGGYPKMTGTLRYRFGAVAGTGKEIMSWIHIDDLCRLYLYAIENENLSGIFNACAPAPVTGKEFMAEAGRQIAGKGFFILHTPVAMLRFILGKVTDEAILQNARVSSKKILRNGFDFQYPAIREAIANLEKNCGD